MIAATPSVPQLSRNSRAMVPSPKAIIVIDCRPPLTAEDVRIHSWINDRLAVVQREKRGLWAKVKRIFDNRPI
ncbi:MAG TPA: hypothetical protein VMF69_20710 [Gemmataceae bacterium]|nr:hypothetical protein [Gemmataceae bacterium]